MVDNLALVGLLQKRVRRCLPLLVFYKKEYTTFSAMADVRQKESRLGWCFLPPTE